MMHLDEPVRPGTPLALTPPELRELIYGRDEDANFDDDILNEEVLDEVTELSDPHRVLRRYAGPVRDEHGMIVGRIVSVEDVTASWQMQRRLTHAQKMESMGRLAGGVAHDFNNLLGTILGFSSLLLEQTPRADTRREALEQIAQSADRASSLTAALLAFSRSARFEHLPVSLNRVIEDSYQILRSTLDPSVAIVQHLEPALPLLQGDALLLQQIVVNLVQELRDRLVAGGTLHLLTRTFDQPRPAEEQEVEPRTQRMVALEIQAGGQPSGPRALASPPVRSAEGTGLALTIVEDIARAHGGYVVAHTGTDAALFEIVFPAEPTEESGLMTPEPATAHGHETILFVDDEPGLRALAKSGLRQRGFDVVTVSNGEQALDILRKDEPSVDVVLLDLTMPGLSGEKVLRALRGFKPDLPVIIASGYATVESQSSWIAAGASGFLAKPYRVQDVAMKLREVLDRAHGAPR
jgi:nitrogen-specific signal transduction histidine kinase/ActR/RegA family two-component response regulator